MVVIVKARGEGLPSESRDLMLRGAVELFRELGYSGAGFRELISHSGAPRGSIYHYFPGGKAQLAEETVHVAGDFIRKVIEEAMHAGNPVVALGIFVDAWRSSLEATEFRAGCPVVGVANEAHEDAPQLANAAAAAFASWEAAIAAALRRAGIERGRARRLAALVISAVEGATIVCRARRDTQALDDVERELEVMIQAALQGAEAVGES